MNEIIEITRANYIFNQIFLLVTTLLAVFLTTWIYKSPKTRWGNFGWVFLSSATIGAVILFFSIAQPDMIFDFITKLKGFIGI